MNKTKQHIQDFFRHYRPENDTHRLAILQFCTQQRIAFAFAEGTDERQPVTLEAFRAWFEHYTPQRRDVITLSDGTVGIVDMAGLDNVRLYVSLSQGVLTTEPHLFSAASMRPASKEETLALQHALYGKGLAWNDRRCTVSPRIVPEENIRYKISVLGRKVGYGIFREIDKEGRLVMYCVKLEEGSLRCSMREVLGPASDYQLEPLYAKLREELTGELMQAGWHWNGINRRMEPVSYRVEAGQEYYYLNDVWSIGKAVYRNNKQHQRFYTQGNYFRELGEVVAFRNWIQEALKGYTVSRRGGAVYYYLKRNWGVYKETDQDRNKDQKRAFAKNYFPSKDRAEEFFARMQQQRTLSLFEYWSKPKKRRYTVRKEK